jgi:hypothetical protein
MGKRIIIKGADFSVNGFVSPNVLILDDTLCINKGCGVLYQSGELSDDTYPTWSASDLVNIEGLSTLTFTSVYEGTNFGLAFFSSNDINSYISGIRYDKQVGTMIDIPDGAKYIRFCSYNIHKTILTLQ